MITAEEFLRLFLENDEEAPEGAVEMADSDWISQGKTEYREVVYEYNKQHFEITASRSNSGYWGDPEWYTPVCTEVKPKKVTKTIYVAV